jgi:hypothetical protein
MTIPTLKALETHCLNGIDHSKPAAATLTALIGLRDTPGVDYFHIFTCTASWKDNPKNQPELKRVEQMGFRPYVLENFEPSTIESVKAKIRAACDQCQSEIPWEDKAFYLKQELGAVWEYQDYESK